MARPFYPFVDNDPTQGSGRPDEALPSPQGKPPAGEVRYPARIAVYDDAAAAPRVVIIDPKDVRSYLEEITSEVTRLSHEQGGTIPFMVIREIVENFIHAYFIEPTISILDGGDTIRFSDQGPGIKEKDRALEYGTSSATEEMKQYIRGVGSGLPYAQQYMVDKGGSLTIEDNISQGTIVTLSTKPEGARQATGMKADPGLNAGQGTTAPYQQMPAAPYQAGAYPSLQSRGQTGYPSGYPLQSGAYPTQFQQGGAGYPQPYPGPQPAAPVYPTYPQQSPAPQGWQGWQANQPQQQPVQSSEAPSSPAAFSWVSVSHRGQAILAYLALHESVGPTELAREYGESQPTWTRELKTLEEDGLIKKDGQKRRLTRMGEAYVSAQS